MAYSSYFTTMAEFNSACPDCADGRGIPRTVTAERGTFMVTLICDKCGHKWTTERKPEVQFFQRWEQVPLHTP